jgi:hypothetical protein
LVDRIETTRGSEKFFVKRLRLLRIAASIYEVSNLAFVVKSNVITSVSAAGLLYIQNNKDSVPAFEQHGQTVSRRIGVSSMAK